MLGRRGIASLPALGSVRRSRSGMVAARARVSKALAVCLPLSSTTLMVSGNLAAQTGNSATPQAAAPFPTQTFKSWALDCIVPKSGTTTGKRVCFIHHEAKALADPKLVAARTVIRHSSTDRKLLLIVELPPNTLQTDGISVVVDIAPARPIPISGCIPKFCYGAIELTPDLEAAAKAGQQMKLTFTARDKGPQTVPVPLSGITAALEALERTGS
jgi:invasion protein IalB